MHRKVEVKNRTGKVLASYPIEVNLMGDDPVDADFIAEARKCAREDRLVPHEELDQLQFEVLHK